MCTLQGEGNAPGLLPLVKLLDRSGLPTDVKLMSNMVCFGAACPGQIWKIIVPVMLGNWRLDSDVNSHACAGQHHDAEGGRFGRTWDHRPA